MLVGGIVSIIDGVSGRSSAPSLVSVGGIVPHHWCQWEELCPIIGVSGKNCAHHWCQWEE
ncbi:unnamed protein product [Staurois parvus]|uniref:Uncharacterized protein n=1 Tax=Staurois parvus TaxID=386267 RepID=A0ABN9C9E4_9NEOB|nr:unnamed protein product [Staurois parvus]